MKKITTMLKRSWVGLLLVVPFFIFAQPSNNDCANAILLSSTADVCSISATQIDIEGATLSETAPPCIPEATVDVWYQVAIPGSGDLGVALTQILNSSGPGSVAPAVAIYSGTCGALTLEVCENTFGNTFTRFETSAFTMGEVVFVRVSLANTNVESLQLGFYDAGAIIPAPSNDDCSNAISLNVTANGAPLDPTEACLLNATSSNLGGDCEFDESADLWYNLVVPTSGLLTVGVGHANLPSGSLPTNLEFYLGDCNAETVCPETGCRDFEDPFSSFEVSFGELDGLVPGQEIHFRVLFEQELFSETSILVYAYDPLDPQGPSNDLCDNAIELPVNTAACFDELPPGFTVEGSSSSGPITSSNICQADGDIWFKVRVPASDSLCSFLNLNRDGLNASGFGQSFYVGDDCDNLTLIPSEDLTFFADLGSVAFGPNKTGISEGDFIWVQFTGTFNSAFHYFFDPISAASSPVNDNCSNATPLAVNGPGLNLNAQEDCFFGATASGVLPVPTCSDFPGADLWYTVQMPSSGFLNLNLSGSGLNGFGIAANADFEVYSGSCGGLSPIKCGINVGRPDQDISIISLGEQDDINPGETLFIRVWLKNLTKNTSFKLSAKDPLRETPPGNDQCIGATLLSINTEPCSMSFVEGTLLNAQYSGLETSDECRQFSPSADVWYQAVIPNSGQLGIATSSIPGSGIIDLQLEVFTGTCDNLTSIICEDNGLIPTLFLDANSNADIDPGETVWIKVSSLGNIGAFGIAAYVPGTAPTNDDCSNATTLPLSQSCEEVNALPVCLYQLNPSPILGDLEECDNLDSEDIIGDLWYQVTVPQTGEVAIGFEGRQGDFTDYYLAIRRGNTCSDPIPELLNCTFINLFNSDLSFSETILLGNADGISPGDNIYVQLIAVRPFPTANVNDVSLNASIYAYSPTNATPANDDCTGAIELTVLPSNECVPITFCNFNATNSDVPAPSCDADFEGEDVWFKLTVPANGIVALSDDNPKGDGRFVIYANDCGSLVELACMGNEVKSIGLAGRTPGEELLVRYYVNGFNFGRGNEDFPKLGRFDVCAFTAPAPSTCGSLEYRQTITRRGSEIGFTGGSTNYAFELPEGQLQGIQATLYLSGLMDLSALEEYIAVLGEGGAVLGKLFSRLGSDNRSENACDYNVIEFNLTAEELEGLLDDGILEFDAVTSFEVMDVCDPDSELSMSLVLCYDLIPEEEEEPEEIPVFTIGQKIVFQLLILLLSIGLFASFTLRRRM